MKALSMLDHVMLWVARAFSFLLVFWGSNEFVKDIASFGISFASLFPAAVEWLLFVSVWLIKRDVFRLILALCSAWALLITSGFLIADFSSSSFTEMVFVRTSPIGFFVMLWIAIRASNNSAHSALPS